MPQLYSSDFSNSIRTLTSLGANTVVFVNNINTAIANGASINVQPGVGQGGQVQFAGVAAANVGYTTGLTDGVTQRISFAGAAGSTIQTTMVGNNAFFPFVTNNGTVAGNINTSAWFLQQ